MSLALPPVGWQSIIEHEPQSTVVCACEKTVVMLKQPGHLTSMKKELGDCTKRLSLCFRFSSLAEGWRRSRTMVFGGVALLGTCVGDRGLLAARASSWLLGRARKSRAVARPEPRSDAFRLCGGHARRGARRRGPRAGARGAFELVKQSSPKSWCSPVDESQPPRLRTQSARLSLEEMRMLS